jgi:hypothetical protein
MNGKLAACVKWHMHYALEEDERDETPATPPLHHPINNCHPNTTTSINTDIRTALSAPAPVPAIHARLVCHASPNTLFGAASHRPQYPHWISTLTPTRYLHIIIPYCPTFPFGFSRLRHHERYFWSFHSTAMQWHGTPTVAAEMTAFILDERTML